MKPHAIIIGPQPRRSRSLHGERRALPQTAGNQARLPVPHRIPHEFYPTPAAAVRALLSVERFDGSIWEPACGEGAIQEGTRWRRKSIPSGTRMTS